MDKNLLNEAESLINPATTQRRDFLKAAAVTTMGVGYVAAAEPESLETCPTTFVLVHGLFAQILKIEQLEKF